MEKSWGIVISISAFLIQFLMFGICLSFGIYVIELQNEFDSGLSIISSIGSVHFGFQLFTGLYAVSLYDHKTILMETQIYMCIKLFNSSLVLYSLEHHLIPCINNCILTTIRSSGQFSNAEDILPEGLFAGILNKQHRTIRFTVHSKYTVSNRLLRRSNRYTFTEYSDFLPGYPNALPYLKVSLHCRYWVFVTLLVFPHTIRSVV